MRGTRTPRTIAAAMAVLAVSAGAVATGLRPVATAAASTGSGCTLWTDASSDAPAGAPTSSQADQLDIVSGSLADDGSNLTTTLTITNLSTTVASGSTANEYYFVFGFGGNQYFTAAEAAATGITYSYGTYSPNGTPQYSGLGSATGTFNQGPNGTVTVTIPFSEAGSPAPGTVFPAGSIFGNTFSLRGVPSNPVASGGSLPSVDKDSATSGYTVGQGCGSGSTPTPTPTPTPSPTPGSGPCTSLCFGPPVVLPQSGVTGSTSTTCFNPCGEPSLVVSPVDGTLYVSTPRTIVLCCNTLASPVWKSGDNGATWSQPIFPSAPGGQNPLTGGDTELAVDKHGTVYEGELWLGSDSIYVSPDKGSTWNWSPASHDLGADREWFVYSPSEDALYGFYDGFKGLMVAKAPLTTPLGSTAAQFFPIERVVVPECAAALATNCPNLPANSVAGIPILPSTESPGRPSVSPVDGTVYFPFSYQVAGQGIAIASTSDGGQSYSYNYVAGAGQGVLGDTASDWPVTAVDTAGNLYVAWVENYGDGFNVYFAASKDKGATWSAPVEVSKGISATAVFPNIVAGAAGQVAVSWYGTSSKGDMNNLPHANWNVYAAEALNATAAQPTFSTGVVQQNFHTGDICTQGAACTGTTRELLDFFDMRIDSTGALGVVYARDQASGGTEIAFSRQVGGCNLNQASCGPTANAPESPTVAALGGAGLAVTGLALMFRRRRKDGSQGVV